eukprot:TRINITY_DN17058_c0_g1_i1.p1 TRINITY_DN17058_c0_g1~~TRINITY_DN17058_c0_g1_i1.p1  ORF type:complete len:180 (-),score=14.62 TRINITY_DN17058_c0_g1_i1:178-717(-)
MDDAAHSKWCPLDDMPACSLEPIYPLHLSRPLMYTAPLPFFTSAAAIMTGFYGLATFEFVLGATSICYWWWPYVNNSWRHVDMVMVVVCMCYAFSLGSRLDSPWREIFLAGLALLAVVLAVNETQMYIRLRWATPTEKVSIWSCNLKTHMLFGHIYVNVFAVAVLICRSCTTGKPGIWL